MAVKQAVMAAERTWLAWWRSALVALAGALAVGRVTPQVLHVASWPYVVLGVGYGLIAIGMVIVGALRHERLARVTLTSADSTLDSRLDRGVQRGRCGGCSVHPRAHPRPDLTGGWAARRRPLPTSGAAWDPE